jgi:acyl-homoserine lactone acylase PvdQ
VSWPGQSGHPGSPHYADQIDRHLSGEYFEVPFDWEEVMAQATNETKLLPLRM